MIDDIWDAEEYIEDSTYCIMEVFILIVGLIIQSIQVLKDNTTVFLASRYIS